MEWVAEPLNWHRFFFSELELKFLPITLNLAYVLCIIDFIFIFNLYYTHVSVECVLKTMTKSPSSAGYSVISHGGDSLAQTPNTRTRFGSSRLHKNFTSLVESMLHVLAATRPLSVMRTSIDSHMTTSPKCEAPSLLITFKQ